VTDCAVGYVPGAGAKVTTGVWAVKVNVALVTALGVRPAAVAIAFIVVFALIAIGPA